MEYLLGILGLLLGAIGFLWIKKQSAEALNQNVDVKNQINKSNETVSKDQGLLEAEAAKRQQVIQDSKTKADEQFKSVKEMEDFLNRDLTKHD